MRASPMLKMLFVFILVIFAANFLGGFFGLYWTWRWFDIPMHVLGGAWIALCGVYLFDERYRLIKLRSLHPLVQCFFLLGFVAIVGIGWEVFEYVLDAIFVSKTLILARSGDLFDTLKDLLDDLIGGFGFFLFYRMLSRKRQGK